VLASRLSEDPARKIGLVEAGPDYGPYAQGRWPEDLLDLSIVAPGLDVERQQFADVSSPRTVWTHGFQRIKVFLH
jgi:hypothetical protein